MTFSIRKLIGPLIFAACWFLASLLPAQSPLVSVVKTKKDNEVVGPNSSKPSLWKNGDGAQIRLTPMVKDRKSVMALNYYVVNEGQECGIRFDVSMGYLRKDYDSIQFSVCGAKGGEMLALGLKDATSEQKLPVGSYLQGRISKEWQTVTIPLSAFNHVGDKITGFSFNFSHAYAQSNASYVDQRSGVLGEIYIDDVKLNPSEEAKAHLPAGQKATNAPAAKVESPADADAITKVNPEIVTRVSNATVTIDVEQKGKGSGFFFKDEEGVWLVSNTHVVGMARTLSELKVRDHTGKEVPLTNTIKADLPGDIAMVKLADSFTPEAVLKLGGAPAIGSTVLAVGNAKGDGIIYPLEGQVKGEGSMGGVPIIEISAKFVPGCSGGPVVDEHGDLLAIITFYISAAQAEKNEAIFTGTPFAEPRRMAVKVGRIKNAMRGTMTDLYIYCRAADERTGTFMLYYVSKMGDEKQKDWVAQVIDNSLKEADQSPLKLAIQGVRPSGMLEEYYQALKELARLQKSRHQDKQSEKQFLTLLKKRLDGTALDKEKQDFIDQYIKRRLLELQDPHSRG